VVGADASSAFPSALEFRTSAAELVDGAGPAETEVILSLSDARSAEKNHCNYR
jgi:hypothetical protein